jgi:hypothetical protein
MMEIALMLLTTNIAVEAIGAGHVHKLPIAAAVCIACHLLRETPQ